MKSSPFEILQSSPYPQKLIQLGPRLYLEWHLAGSNEAIGCSFENLGDKPPDGNANRLWSALERLPEKLQRFGYIQPTLFVFQASRCGSSLLARSLEAQPTNRVFLEPAPINHLVQCASLESASKNLLIESLIKAYGLGAQDKQNALIVKFSSFVCWYFDVIQDIFPQVSKVFLCRHPLEILVSLTEKPPKWLAGKSPSALLRKLGYQPLDESDTDTIEDRCCWYLERLLKHVIQNRSHFQEILIYPDFISHIPELHRTYCAEDLPDTWRDLLQRHAKHPEQAFKPDSEAKQTRASASLRSFYETSLEPLWNQMISD